MFNLCSREGASEHIIVLEDTVEIVPKPFHSLAYCALRITKEENVYTLHLHYNLFLRQLSLIRKLLFFSLLMIFTYISDEPPVNIIRQIMYYAVEFTFDVK